jgi:hypothetical protein
MDDSNEQGSSDDQPLSKDQLGDVVDSLRKPLSNRKVLLPFGNQAFFAAHLCPSLNEANEELVQVKLSDGCLRQMTRTEARDLLQEEYNEAHTTSKKKEQKPELSARKQESPPTSSTPSSTASAAPTSHILPFYDIREEIDESGKPLKGEATDISAKLNDLQTVVGTDGIESKELEAPTIQEETDALKKLNDDEYDSLAARLEELARLEENAEQQMASSQQSRTSITSKSWSKGFLNKAKTTATPPLQQTTSGMDNDDVREGNQSLSAKNQSSQAVQQGPPKKLTTYNKPTGWSKGFLNSKSKPERDDTCRRVVFKDEATVQEIPRNTNDSLSPNNHVENDRPLPVIQSFDEHVVSSVVVEHVVAHQQPQEPPIVEPTKKLSRFAQRRLEALQEQQ